MSMGTQFVTIVGGQQVSSCFALDPPGGGFAIFVASHAQVQISIDFASTSGGGSELNWFRHTTAAGNNYVIASSTPLPAVGIVERAVTPWVRLKFGAVAQATTSAQIVPLR